MDKIYDDFAKVLLSYLEKVRKDLDPSYRLRDQAPRRKLYVNIYIFYSVYFKKSNDEPTICNKSFVVPLDIQIEDLEKKYYKKHIKNMPV